MKMSTHQFSVVSYRTNLFLKVQFLIQPQPCEEYVWLVFENASLKLVEMRFGAFEIRNTSANWIRDFHTFLKIVPDLSALSFSRWEVQLVYLCIAFMNLANPSFKT